MLFFDHLVYISFTTVVVLHKSLDLLEKDFFGALGLIFSPTKKELKKP